ncbi:hypothetical protein [Telmatospirillum siberiense]|uniref:hypothetical protein n=1 Tax=Telmatospirillum siberiense TaxID=382514 RepID=UPI0011AF8759|nr:hypothetical protein [Telmatospirillum siberiense]
MTERAFTKLRDHPTTIVKSPRITPSLPWLADRDRYRQFATPAQDAFPNLRSSELIRVSL